MMVLREFEMFMGFDNRMKTGYLLRDVMNQSVDTHFTSSDELQALGALYESMAPRSARRRRRFR